MTTDDNVPCWRDLADQLTDEQIAELISHRDRRQRGALRRDRERRVSLAVSA
jgi:hypothetical protein